MAAYYSVNVYMFGEKDNAISIRWLIISGIISFHLIVSINYLKSNYPQTGSFDRLVLCQHIIVCRDSEIAPTDGLLRVGGNSDSRLLYRS